MSLVVAAAACVSGLLLQPVPHVRALRSRAGPAIFAQEGGQLAQLGDQFEAALGSLPAEERYNAVLESLLAKQGNVEPALDLVEEMSIKRVKLSDKATKSLLDFGVSSVNMTLLNRIFVAAQCNGACRNFALPALKPGAKPNAAALSALPIHASHAGREVQPLSGSSCAAACSANHSPDSTGRASRRARSRGR